MSQKEGMREISIVGPDKKSHMFWWFMWKLAYWSPLIAAHLLHFREFSDFRVDGSSAEMALRSMNLATPALFRLS